MNKFFVATLLGVVSMSGAICDTPDATLQAAINNAANACAGIADEMVDIKKMAGVNTAITGIGTGAAVAGGAVGLAKVAVDEQASDLERMLREIEAQNDDVVMEYREPTADFEMQLKIRLSSMTSSEIAEKRNELEQKLAAANEKSKTLGNVRTGMLAASTATSIASAVIAANNKVDQDLRTRVQECIAAVDDLRNARAQAHMDGLDQASDVAQRAQHITDVCGRYDLAMFDKVNDKAKGATISSAIGIATAGAGTVTSAIANTDATRNDNSAHGQKKEENLNRASNVLAFGAAGSSLVGTVFNATQISAAKNIISIATDCEEALR